MQIIVIGECAYLLTITVKSCTLKIYNWIFHIDSPVNVDNLLCSMPDNIGQHSIIYEFRKMYQPSNFNRQL